jgi:hypothetical protein
VKQAEADRRAVPREQPGAHVFTPARLAVLKLLASQAAISLENARLYTDLRRSEAF